MLTTFLANKWRIWAGPQPAHTTIQCAVSLIALCLSCTVLFLIIGCSGAGQSVDALFATASSQLADARKSGAEQHAEPQLEAAISLLAEAEVAIENKDKGARALLEKASAQARLAEALARQSRAETETAKLEVELGKASTEADQARQERQSAENKLAQMMTE